MVQPVIGAALAPEVDGGACPHFAVLLRSAEEFAPIVASFYSLGAKRRGWLVHRGVRPDDDRQALAGAGLDVAGLEAERQFAIERLRLDEPPEDLPRRVAPAFDEALDRGLTALWSSHTPVAADPDSFAHAMSIERAWEEQFRDRPVSNPVPVHSRRGWRRQPRSAAWPSWPAATTACWCRPTTASGCSSRPESAARPRARGQAADDPVTLR